MSLEHCSLRATGYHNIRLCHMTITVQVHQKVTTDIEQIETELVSWYNPPCTASFHGTLECMHGVLEIDRHR